MGQVSSQLIFNDNQSYETYGTVQDYKLNIEAKVTLGTDQVGEFYWQIVRPDSIPSEWVFSVCDQNTCYAPGVETCPTTKPNFIEPGGSVTFIIYLEPKAVAGLGDIGFRLFDTENQELEFTHVDLYWEITGSVSTNDLSEANVKIYPNPASEYFMVDNDENIAQVSIFSIVGKEIVSYVHTPGQAYSVSDLNRGIYMVRLSDQRNRIIKVIRCQVR